MLMRVPVFVVTGEEREDFWVVELLSFWLFGNGLLGKQSVSASFPFRASVASWKVLNI